MRLKLLACEIFFRELSHLCANGPHTIDAVYLPKGLHDLGQEKMIARLQAQVDAVPPGRYDAILMAYGLCNNGLVGLTCSHTRLVAPRAHDCITLFLGSRDRYRQFFDAHPGTYYRTTGWLEREDPDSAGEPTVSQRLGLTFQYEELVAKYGEDNAQYVMEMLGDTRAHYDRIVFIGMGLPCEAPFVETARQEAAKRGWAFEQVDGSMELLRRLICGEWDANFLIVEPGRSLKASHDDGVIRAD
jgi:hypothetical protein